MNYIELEKQKNKPGSARNLIEENITYQQRRES